ncbi:helix-turn-helix domain-containing protein [Mesorhizobium sp. VK25A]|uniref:Helix-turn-helix domain-containing protein n=1 Tax=Mesorhizobium vachelliae TaxID=3072309 RepID=A0ABU5AEA3_9HYPH|nr:MULTISPECIES: helix-turn-helix domain-containing protein [unclassified Mesorhizobium]MDX8535608.1 helix-turn-helix domain-containing protein [Mesorhizobium sp. VK25D]MDX8548361.1 helix-turn-helix domain-containing protein [Mesorhizobium sp. VK25A]
MTGRLKSEKKYLLDEMTRGDMAPEELPLFRGLPASRRAELLRHAMVHSVSPGTVLFEQGDVPNFQLVVLAGSAQLFGRSAEGREVLIEAARAPDLIIPAAVLTDAPYLMQARVPEPSRFLLIHAAAFRAAVDADPLLAHAVIGSLAHQFRRMVRQIKNLKLRTATQRVGCYLLALSKRQGTPDRAVLPFEKTLIASELGITRESFSRALSSLGQSGIRVDGQTIAILDARRLAAACTPDPLIDGADAGDFLI